MNGVFTSPEAEKYVIGAMLQDTKAVDLHAMLSEFDFSDISMRLAFKAIRSLALSNKPIDIETVDHEMAKGFGRIGNPYTSNLIEAISNVPTTVNIKQYIDIVKDKSIRRQLADVATQISVMASDLSTDVSVTLDSAKNILYQMNSGNAVWTPIGDVMMETYSNLEKRMNGSLQLIPTGIETFDTNFGGIEKGEYVIIGARPSVGKSALGIHMAVTAAKKGYKVGVISREMTATQYGNRLISSAAVISGSKLRKGNLNDSEIQNVVEAIGVIADLPIEFLFPISNIELLQMEIKKKVNAGELDMLVVDYLQLLTIEERNKKDYARIGVISGALRNMTRDLHIPIIALAQLNRLSEGVRRIPQLHDLRESGNIEQDADVVILMHKCENADDPGIISIDTQNFEALTCNGYQYITLFIAKGRQSGTGKLAILFHPETMQYFSIVR